MQGDAWARKSLQSFLGSYAELKHDTVLYAKQVMVEMGGGMIPEKDDRGYVEPEPVVYRRLANLTAATSDGLAGFGLLSDKDAEDLALLGDLAERLAVISDKELREEEPSAEEYDLIRGFGGNLEHFWQRVYEDEDDDGHFTAKDYPAALVTDIATDGDSGEVLQIGTGKVSPIYVVVPIGGELHLTKGAVFSFYQFRQPMSNRLTDSAWRDAVSSEAVSGVEDWTRDFQTEWTPSW